MSHQASNTDIHATVSGRKARIATSDNCLHIWFGKETQPVEMQWSNVITSVQIDRTVGVCLKQPACILPKTRRPVHSFKISENDKKKEDYFNQILQNFAEKTDCICVSTETPSISTVSSSMKLFFVENKDESHSVVVWQDRKCAVARTIKGIVLQRTTGGMSTYDAHIVPTLGEVITAEMLPHGSMLQWPDCFGDENVIDAGADPIPLEIVQESQQFPTLKQYFDEFLGESDSMSVTSEEESEWDESESSDDDSDVSFISSSSGEESC